MNRYLSILPVVACIFMFISLNGCTGRIHTEIIRPPLNIPSAMYECEDSTPHPKGEVIMESEVAKYIASLQYVEKDCKLRLKELSVIVKCYNDKDCNVDKLIEYAGLIKEETKK